MIPLTVTFVVGFSAGFVAVAMLALAARRESDRHRAERDRERRMRRGSEEAARQRLHGEEGAT